MARQKILGKCGVVADRVFGSVLSPIPERIYRAQVNGDLGMLSMRMFEEHWCGSMRGGGPRMVLRGGNILRYM